MAWKHFSRAIVAAVALGSTAWARQATTPAAPPAGSSTFLVLVRLIQIGTEEVNVSRSSDGWTISSAGRMGPPIDFVTRALHIRYSTDWKPLELTLDATSHGQALGMHTTVTGTTATTHINNAGQPIDATHTIDASAMLLPNPLFAAYEAVAVALGGASVGSTIPVYQGGSNPTVLRVTTLDTENIQTVARRIQARHAHALLSVAGSGDVPLEVWGDVSGRLLRVSIPAQGFEYVRDDVAAVSTRRVVISRPTDEQVFVPANGFNLAGTLSFPAAPAPRNPAVVLVAGSGPMDRDETVAGIPVLGQLAGQLADAGYIVLRYDKRGLGQSGGRVESASLSDYADDLRAAVKYLADRRDVDGRRIAVVGHSEGGSIALLEAAKDGRPAAVVLVGSPGLSGADVVLAQQKHALDHLNLSDADKQARIDLQKKIQEAVISGKGWDGVPPELRRQADNPEFQSILQFDPSQVIAKVRQPILVVQGMLDTQVEPANADRLETLARGRKGRTVDIVKIPGVNHLFVPAESGEVTEYASLKDKQITPALASAIADWLKKTLPSK